MPNNIIDSIQLSGTVYTLSAQTGGGKAIEAGRGISVTTGETADTVSFNLPISAGTGINSIIENKFNNTASGPNSHAEGSNTTASDASSHAEGDYTKANGVSSHAEGSFTKANGTDSHTEGTSTIANGTNSHAEGGGTKANGNNSHAEGSNTVANNNSEHASGQFNVSSSGSSTFGDSGNTLFSVGNGTSNSARHNAFEIRQNGDIYLTKDGQDVKLQDQLGGSSITIDPSLDSGSTNAVANSAITEAIMVGEYALKTKIPNKIQVEPFQKLLVEPVTSGTYADVTYLAISISGNDNTTDNLFVDSFSGHTIETTPTNLNCTWLDDNYLLLTPKNNSNYITMVEQVWDTGKNVYSIENLQSGSSSSIIENTIFPKIEDINYKVNAKVDTYISGTSINNLYNDYGGYWYHELKMKDNTNRELSWLQKMKYSDFGLEDDCITVKRTSAVTSASTSAETPSAKAVYESVSGKVDTSAFTAYSASVETALSGKQDTLSAGTGIEISGNVISAEGGGKAIEAGRGISVTTGETADTVSFSLPISAGTGINSLILNYSGNTANGKYSVAEGSGTTANNFYSHAEGYGTSAEGNVSHAEGRVTNASGYASHAEGEETIASGETSHAEGLGTRAGGNSSHAEGWGTWAIGNDSHSEGVSTRANGISSHAEGRNTVANNRSEHASGQYNVSNSATTTFGDSGNTLFSIGNGTADNARHNAFEIRQNGDIYLTSGGTDIKLQDHLGGSSINVVQTTGTSTADVMSQNAVSTKLSGYVTTDTEQTISGKKIFKNSDKPIEFKQNTNNSKVGFSIKNTANTNNELATFELRPNTFTIDNVQHPLMYFGHYRTTNIANAGVPQTVIGFRQYDQLNAAAYHYLMPLPEKAKTPFSLTKSFKDYYAPMGFKVDSGGTMVTTDNTGVVDLSSYLGGGGSDINVVQTTGTSTTDVMSQNAVSTQLNNKANSTAAVGGYKFGTYNDVDYLQYTNVKNSNIGNSIYYPKINGKGIFTSNSIYAQNNYNFQLVETSAITTSVTSSSTDSQIPSAKAVNDKLGGLSLVKLTQAEYDALATKDSNTLYVIVN